MGKIIKICLINVIDIVVLLEIGLQLISPVIKEDRSNASLLNQGLRILVLGDSNTFGLFGAAEQASLAQLEKIINWNGTRATVFNYGYPGNSSTKIAENLGELVSKTQPDLVLILVGVNDVWNYPVNYSLSEKNEGFFPTIGQVKSHSIVQNTPEVKSGKINEGARHFDFVEKSAKEKMEYLKENMSQEYAGRPFNRTKRVVDQDYVSTMNDISRYLRDKRTPVITLNYPANMRNCKAANNRIAMLKDGFVHYDITGEFQRSCENKSCDNLLFKDQHPGVEGRALYADLVYEALLDHAEIKDLFGKKLST